MSSANARFPLRQPLAQAVDLCGRALIAAGWKPRGTGSPQPGVTLLAGKDSWNPLSFANPARVRCEARATSETECQITVTVSNMGFGPIQSGHVQRRLDETINAIRDMLSSQAPHPPTPSPQ